MSHKFRTNLLELGFSHTLEVGRTPYDSEYLSKRFYPTPDGHLLGGKIGRVLSRAGWFINIKDEQTCYSAALSALQDNHHVPFLRQYFEKVVYLCKKQRFKMGTGKVAPHQVHAASKHEYDDSTWDFVTEKYGLTKDDLSVFESLLSTVDSLPVAIEWPPLLHCLEVDGA